MLAMVIEELLMWDEVPLGVLSELFPAFERHYSWYRAQTENKPLQCSFSFKKRSVSACEESAMEDYPRGHS